MASNPLGKVPGSVWSIASEPLTVPDSLGVDHFAAFPSEWPRRIVLGWCPPHDGVVLDPFCGTGTTVAVAHLLGRHGIGVDLSKDYLRLAEWRCTKDRALRSKVLDRSGLPKPPKCDGQLDLFSEAAS
jgi:DNA modification methylase